MYQLIYEEKGEFVEAIGMAYQAAVACGTEPAKAAQSSNDLYRTFSVAGAPGYWKERLRKANAQSTFAGDLYSIAVFHMRLGETNASLDFLEKVEATRSDIAYNVNFDRRFDSLRGTPRFKALLRKLGLEN